MVTIGVKLYYKKTESEDDIKDIDSISDIDTIDTQLVGVQNFPELQTAPSPIDVTSLEDFEEQSEPGLISGSSLGITMNYKENVYSAGTEDKSNFEECLDLQESDFPHLWKIQLPNGRWFVFYAKSRATTGAFAVASPLQFTLTLYKRSRVRTGFTSVSATGYGMRAGTEVDEMLNGDGSAVDET